jgi:hypothetical protein
MSAALRSSLHPCGDHHQQRRRRVGSKDVVQPLERVVVGPMGVIKDQKKR